MSARFVHVVAPGYSVSALQTGNEKLELRVCVPGEEDMVCVGATWRHVDDAVQYVAMRAAEGPRETGSPMLGLLVAGALMLVTSGAFWLGWLLCH